MSEVLKKRLSYMNAAEVMDRVFDVYRHSLLYQIALNFCVYTIGGAALYGILIAAAAAGVLAGSIFVSAAGDTGIVILAAIGAAALIWLIIIYTNLGAAARELLSWQSYSGRAVDFSAALKNTFKSFWRIATLSLAEMAAGILLMLLLCSALYAVFAGQGILSREFWVYGRYYSLFTFRNLLFLSAIILFISTLALIVYNCFALALPAAVFDRKYFMEGIISSYRLMKGDFWRILGIRIVFSGEMMLIHYSLSSLSAVLIGFSNALYGSLSPNIYALMMAAVGIQYAISFITSILLTPLPGILTSILFFNQKIKREGMDLAMRLEILERSHGL
ncbi:MAG: hypothetical protein LBB94_12065 [Clostridiales bacterium]|jgi:hypothetical protein|nr:hypothetical protein [Clostridiales bacterium]